MTARVTADDLLVATLAAMRSADCGKGYCKGPDVPPESMLTCPVCWEGWRIRTYLRKIGKD